MELKDVIQTFGLPTGMVLVLLFGIYKVGSWTGEFIKTTIAPKIDLVVKAHLDFLEVMKQSQGQITTNLDVHDKKQMNKLEEVHKDVIGIPGKVMHLLDVSKPKPS